MKRFRTRIDSSVAVGWLERIGRDARGQDMIEYALMAAAVAVGTGALLPTVTASISTIFSKVVSVVSTAAS